MGTWLDGSPRKTAASRLEESRSHAPEIIDVPDNTPSKPPIIPARKFNAGGKVKNYCKGGKVISSKNY
jgi:hypothetical protein